MEPELARLQTYWKDLIRGENFMPFSDDINLSAIPELTSRVILVQAFENPERFRFEHAGEHITSHYGTPLKGLFTDEVRGEWALEELTRQCSVTVARRVWTFSDLPPVKRPQTMREFSRRHGVRAISCCSSVRWSALPAKLPRQL